MKKALVLMVLGMFLASCAAPVAVANGGQQEPVVAAQGSEKPAPVPTLEQLEANLKQMEERYPKLVEAVQKMQGDILILRGAIAREKQLKGEEAK